MNKRKALGSGLEALLSNKLVPGVGKVAQNNNQRKVNASEQIIIKIPIENIS